ncbi:MAG: hypothetical protein CMO80_15285 [Verrucomicrobiales bacterium]|nr:hypothetical protein [Verrucomicrobiales bacterium]|tara:strand:+ start:2286 stop:3746 length:1461 start_codon:yes stop_codon:yes gene_type:complete
MPFNWDNTYARLPAPFFERVDPSPVRAPELIAVNDLLAEELGIDVERLRAEVGLDILSGNKIAEGSEPIAMAYSGHQFGGLAPQLGDGRALLLGEVIGRDKVRRDVQLKGSGPTPFSRRGDGRSALGPVLREYIVSEAMHALGVSTTRALAAVASGDQVFRDGAEPGGVFTRVARSHIRVGTFEWFALRKDHENLRVLADYVINRHYPEAMDHDEPYRALLRGVVTRQARLVAHWMQLGFIHGVMNTDNTNVSGETIDYGPCAFMDAYHPSKKFSSIDHHGRYAFNNQGSIMLWNLSRFAETLLTLLDEDTDQAVKIAESELDLFAGQHQEALRIRFTRKIGLDAGAPDDWALLQSLLKLMAEQKVDFTLAFRRLTCALDSGADEEFAGLFSCRDGISAWLKSWCERLREEDPSRTLQFMRAANPIFIPRNHRVEEAIRAGYEGDFKPFHCLNDVLKNPFEERADCSEYELPPKPEQIVQATFCGT